MDELSTPLETRSLNHNHREGHADRTASSDSRHTVLVQECFPLPPLAGVSGMDLRLLYVQYLAHDDHQNFNFLFRLR
jgi:hypothetical protein